MNLFQDFNKTGNQHALTGFSNDCSFFWGASGTTLELYKTKEPKDLHLKWNFHDNCVVGVHLEMIELGENKVFHFVMVLLTSIQGGNSQLQLLSAERNVGSDEGNITPLVKWTDLERGATAMSVIRSCFGSYESVEERPTYTLAVGTAGGKCVVSTISFDCQEALMRHLISAEPLKYFHEYTQSFMTEEGVGRVVSIIFLSNGLFAVAWSNGVVQVHCYDHLTDECKPLETLRPPNNSSEIICLLRHQETNAPSHHFWVVWSRLDSRFQMSGSMEADVVVVSTENASNFKMNAFKILNIPQAATAISLEIQGATSQVLAILVPCGENDCSIQIWDAAGKLLDEYQYHKVPRSGFSYSIWLNPSKLCSFQQWGHPRNMQFSLCWEAKMLIWSPFPTAQELHRLELVENKNATHKVLQKLEEKGFRIMLEDTFSGLCRDACLVCRSASEMEDVDESSNVVDACDAVLNIGKAPLVCALVLGREDGNTGHTGFLLEQIVVLERWACKLVNEELIKLKLAAEKRTQFFPNRLEGIHLVFQALLERHLQTNYSHNHLDTANTSCPDISIHAEYTEAMLVSCRIWQVLAETAMKNQCSYNELFNKIVQLQDHKRAVRMHYENEAAALWKEDITSNSISSTKLLVDILTNSSHSVDDLLKISLRPFQFVQEHKISQDFKPNCSLGVARSLYDLIDVWQVCLQNTAGNEFDLISWVSFLCSSLGVGNEASDAVLAIWLVDTAPAEASAAVAIFLRPGVKLELEGELYLGVLEALLIANQPAEALRLLQGKPPKQWTEGLLVAHMRAALMTNLKEKAFAVLSQSPFECRAKLFHQICCWYHHNGQMELLMDCPMGEIEFLELDRFLKEIFKVEQQSDGLSPALDLLIGIFLQYMEITPALLCHEIHADSLQQNEEILQHPDFLNRKALLDNYFLLLPLSQQQFLAGARRKGQASYINALDFLAKTASPRPNEILYTLKDKIIAVSTLQQEELLNAKEPQILTLRHHRDGVFIQEPSIQSLSGPETDQLQERALSKNFKLSQISSLRNPPTPLRYRPPAHRITNLITQNGNDSNAAINLEAGCTFQVDRKHCETPEGFCSERKAHFPRRGTPHPKSQNARYSNMDVDVSEISACTQTPPLDSSEFHYGREFRRESLLGTPESLLQTGSFQAVNSSTRRSNNLFNGQNGGHEPAIKTPAKGKKHVHFQETGGLSQR